MLVIRLQRTGRENTPTFRIVVSEKTKSAKSGMQEIVGHFIPNRETPVFECKQDRIEYWISKGAQPSNTLARHLRRIGMKNMEKFIIKYAKQKSKSEVPAPVAAPAAPATTPAPVASVAPAEVPAAAERPKVA
ncbi:30S ribosomal protein S16 [Candidatus Peribacteria bacterium]|nr:30S ribosomal protein S16 [Candidatus Peribacteria bacterium]